MSHDANLHFQTSVLRRTLPLSTLSLLKHLTLGPDDIHNTTHNYSIYELRDASLSFRLSSCKTARCTVVGLPLRNCARWAFAFAVFLMCD